jgi:hypothetical protein
MYSAHQTANGLASMEGTINPAQLNSSSSKLLQVARMRFLHPNAKLQFIHSCAASSSRSLLTLDLHPVISNPPQTITPDTSPRGVKRSRTPDTYGDLPTGDGGADDGTSICSHRSASTAALRYFLSYNA